MIKALITLCLLPAFASAMRLSGPLDTPVGSNPRGLCIADLDNDGVNEVVVANFGSTTLIGQDTASPAGSLSIVKWNGSALAVASTLATGKSPRSVAAIDLNGDRRLDLVASFYDENSLGVYFQNSDGSFAPVVTVGTGSKPVGIAALKPFGTPLVAVANYGAHTISLYEPDGRAGLVLKETLATGSNPTDVKFHFANGQRPYLIAANYLGNSLSFWPIDGAKAGERKDMAVAGNPCKIAVGALNDDGRDDLAVAVFQNNQVAQLNAESDYFSAPALAPIAGLHPNGIALGLLSGSKKNWVATAGRDNDTLDLLQDRGAGLAKVLTLSVKVADGGMYGPVEVTIGDVNGDGRADLLTTHMRSGLLKAFIQAPPSAPTIISSTHPDPAIAYANANAQFAFAAGEDLDGISGYMVEVDDKAGTVPTGKAQAEAALSLNGVDTGTHYVHVRSVDAFGNAGETAHYKFQVTAEMSQSNVYNYPNPSRTGRTTIRFPLTAPADVSIRILDDEGKEVWSLAIPASSTQVGVNSIEWDGRNSQGQPAGNGGYILLVSANGKTITKKIAIVR